MAQTTKLDIKEAESEATSSSYDQIPYPTRANTETHLDHLASVATLFGMSPPAVEKSRVLEVGCGDGGNLIPMAMSLPHSEFVGIDLAALPIAQALRTIESAGVENVRVQAMDLMDITPAFGTFDYIIAHGFYSWVPAVVQERLLAVCKENLSPNGVAFVSYNAYPDGHLRKASREMMLFHLDRMRGPADRVLEGRRFLGLMAKSVEPVEPTEVWKAVLESESRRLDQRDDRVTYHDELNPSCYSPVYFADFVRSAERHGLQFVGDANIRDEISPPVKPEIIATIDELAGSDMIARQQYLDFVMFTGFHRSLLCHAGIELGRRQPVDHIARLWVASPLERAGTSSDGATEFRNLRGPGTIKTDNPRLIAVLRMLEGMWPGGDRLEALESRTSEQGGDGPAALREAILTLAMNKLVDLRAHSAHVSKGLSERPVASPFARFQAKSGTLITTLLHTQIEIEDEITRRLLELLDGTRDLSMLIHSLAAQFPQLTVSPAQVEAILQRFHRIGLLTS